MTDPSNANELLFSYGTLRDEAVQLANFGRNLAGRPDSLRGYTLDSIVIHDPAVVSLSGKSRHTIAVPCANMADEVQGIVFEITALELVASDRYEVADYTRVLVTLKSGADAWVYVRA
jgi:gamma-glutamylcyclotransferase (GGCT)/AIG2-like uncharacterized protein YtfP